MLKGRRNGAGWVKEVNEEHSPYSVLSFPTAEAEKVYRFEADNAVTGQIRAHTMEQRRAQG